MYLHTQNKMHNPLKIKLNYPVVFVMKKSVIFSSVGCRVVIASDSLSSTVKRSDLVSISVSGLVSVLTSDLGMLRSFKMVSSFMSIEDLDFSASVSKLFGLETCSISICRMESIRDDFG